MPWTPVRCRDPLRRRHRPCSVVKERAASAPLGCSDLWSASLRCWTVRIHERVVVAGRAVRWRTGRVVAWWRSVGLDRGEVFSAGRFGSSAAPGGNATSVRWSARWGVAPAMRHLRAVGSPSFVGVVKVVMAVAQQGEVVQVGASAVDPGHDVMDLAHPVRALAARRGAGAIPRDERFADLAIGGSPAVAEVEIPGRAVRDGGEDVGVAE